ncbi:DUF559 domain-containing protein [Isoptericola sp. 4D.3]|uniref:DUF559 domain-containing protein n=1 Tax=Isoptericola peretonis TaxID=2918523 RepID=A0ABT0J5E4_9MICO|nr:DUF559 domain-containing protein [Isoptericola sp. 4D.3]
MDDELFGDNASPFTVADALRTGLSRKQLRAGRRWDAPFTGIRLPAGGATDLRARCRALSEALDDGVAFSHGTALMLLGVELPWTHVHDARLHVITRRSADRAERPGVVAHWTRQTFLETTEIDGLLVTSPAQTLVHVGCDLRMPDDVVVLGDALMRRKRMLTSPAELETIAERTRKVKGIVQVREEISRMRPGTDSSTETRTRLLLVDAGLPCPLVNGVVYAPDGTYVKRVDLLYPSQKVAIEYDGDQHRTDRAQWQDDIRRRRLLESLGWTVIVVVADDLRDPTQLVARVRAALRV